MIDLISEIDKGMLIERNREFLLALHRAHPKMTKALLEQADALTASEPEPEPEPCITDNFVTYDIDVTAPALPARAIANEVAGRHGVDPDRLFSATRARPVAYARQEAFYLIRDRLNYALTQIGRIFDRDHATVLHGIQAHASRNGLRFLSDAKKGRVSR